MRATMLMLPIFHVAKLCRDKIVTVTMPRASRELLASHTTGSVFKGNLYRRLHAALRKVRSAASIRVSIDVSSNE